MESATHKPAGFWVRFLSFIIDLVLATPIFLACRFIEGELMQEVIFTLILILFYTLLLSSNWRATPGMRALKIEAVGTNGAPLSKAHAVYWCIASTFFAALAFAPILYIQWWMTTYGVQDLIAAVGSNQIDPETFNMELQVRTGMTAQQMSGFFIMCLGTTAVLCLIWALSVALSKRKVGWHNWLSATRFVVRQSV